MITLAEFRMAYYCTIHNVSAVYILHMICTFSTCLEYPDDLNVQNTAHCVECIVGYTLDFIPFPVDD